MRALLDTIDSTKPDQAKLLQWRMNVLGLDIGAWARFEPDLFRDLEIACAACTNRQGCADDLLDHVDDPMWKEWRDYCPNSAKLNMLVALQFF